MKLNTDYAGMTAQLESVVVSHCRTDGSAILECHDRASRLSVSWLDYLRNSQATGTADELLDGFHAALIEAAGCLTMGLVRPAVFSIRAQVDILVAWLYFKDHRVEWDHVELTGQKYRLVTEVLKYLRTYRAGFRDRFVLLRSKRTQGDEDPYHLLSAHIHGQNTATLPPLVRIQQLVQDGDRCREGVDLQSEVSEYISDILASCFATEWFDLPDPVTESLAERLEPSSLKVLCAS